MGDFFQVLRPSHNVLTLKDYKLAVDGICWMNVWFRSHDSQQLSAWITTSWKITSSDKTENYLQCSNYGRLRQYEIVEIILSLTPNQSKKILKINLVILPCKRLPYQSKVSGPLLL